MTITETDSKGAAPTPITDTAAWIGALPEVTRGSLIALGELLVGATNQPASNEDAASFTVRGLGAPNFSGVVDEDRDLNAVQRVTVALALQEWIQRHNAEVGPGEYFDPPAYTQTEVGDTTYRYPQILQATFPAGTLLTNAPVVVKIVGRMSVLHSPEVTAYVRHEDQQDARDVLDALMKRGNELNPYRGRAVRATLEQRGLNLAAIALPSTLNRDNVVVHDEVWREIDLGMSAAGAQHKTLNALGLGSRRGVLLAGPPGTGKSAVSAVVANEAVAAGFTVIYVEAKAGEHLLTSVVQEAQQIGGPVLLILEDVDLFVRDRRGGNSTGLAELLQAMDIAPDARILTLASTNDAATLDAAAIRTGRFDSIVEVGYPDRAVAEQILSALVGGIPGLVDARMVASRLPEKTSGSDLREIVRRAVLSGVGDVSTEALLAEINSGRYRAQPAVVGQYL